VFGHRYFGRRYFSNSYFGDGGGVVVVPPVLEPEIVSDRGVWAEHPLKPWRPPEPRKGATRFTERAYLIPERAIAAGVAWGDLRAIESGASDSALAGPYAKAKLNARERTSDLTSAVAPAMCSVPDMEHVNFYELRLEVTRLKSDASEREELELLGLA
jgi:hypothetical protein